MHLINSVSYVALEVISQEIILRLSIIFIVNCECHSAVILAMYEHYMFI